MDIISSSFILIAVVLSFWKSTRIWSLAVNIFGCIFFLFWFWSNGLVSSSLIQLVFISQNIYGLFFYANKSNQISKLSKQEINIGLLLYPVIFTGIFIFTRFYSRIDMIWFDSFITTNAIIASWFVARKKVESWIIWMINDILIMCLFIYTLNFISAGIYLTICITAIVSFIIWSREEKTIKK